jgi:type I restriction enzyme, S subunit
MPKTMLTGRGVGAIHYGQIYTRYGTWTTTTDSFVRPEDAVRLTSADPGDVLITNTSENLDDVGKAVAWLGDSSIVTGGHATIIKHSMDPKYLSYWFQSPAFHAQKARLASGTKVIDVSARQLEKVRVPVPPIEVQREIASILDTFTALRKELEAELEARRRLRLAIAKNVAVARRDTGSLERVRLADLATQYIESVQLAPHEKYVTLGVKWYGEGAFARPPKNGDAIQSPTLRRVRSGQLLYNRMFVVEGSFAIVPPDLATGVVSSEFPVFDLDRTRILPEWLCLYLLDEYTLKRIEAEVTGVERGSSKSRRRWKEDQFMRFEVDLPTIQDQEEILRILRASQDLEGSLADELAARCMQYEYYRDKLLTFEELHESPANHPEPLLDVSV